jgi:hypothetical protein
VPGRMRLPRPRRPRRADVAAAGVVALFLACVCVIGLGLFIQHSLRPIGSPFGLPGQLSFPLCGRDYQLSTLDTMTKVQVEGGITSGYEPFVLEPTVGKIPLFDLFRCPMNKDGFYDTVIWLHVGADEYQAYALEGGP